MILFLIIDNDNHRDPVYNLRHDKQVALDLARKLADEAKEEYGNMLAYSQPCDGKDGLWFCESGEERWHIIVREIELKEKPCLY